MNADIVRQIVREELEKYELKKQSVCMHATNGTILADGFTVACDMCGKVLEAFSTSSNLDEEIKSKALKWRSKN